MSSCPSGGESSPDLRFIHLVAEADQMSAAARDARCCDPFAPCHHCRWLRRSVVSRRYVVRAASRLTATPPAA